MAIIFDDNYFNVEGYKNYSDNPKFLSRATYIKEVLRPVKGVIVLGGAYGHTVKYLEELGVKAINVDTSIYCYNNRVTDSFVTDPTKVKYNDYDWIVSWSVLDCLDETNVDVVCDLLNSFKDKQLHIFSCSNNQSSQKYINDGYFIQLHSYWSVKLATANLVCWDCKKAIQGNLTRVPLMQDWVTD